MLAQRVASRDLEFLQPLAAATIIIFNFARFSGMFYRSP